MNTGWGYHTSHFPKIVCTFRQPLGLPKSFKSRNSRSETWLGYYIGALEKRSCLNMIAERCPRGCPADCDSLLAGEKMEPTPLNQRKKQKKKKRKKKRKRKKKARNRMAGNRSGPQPLEEVARDHGACGASPCIGCMARFQQRLMSC